MKKDNLKFLVALVLIQATSATAFAFGNARPQPPAVPSSGSFCAALVTNGLPNRMDVNNAPMYDQNDSVFVNDVGQHNPDLCGPVSATHLIGGFGDYQNVIKGSPVQLVASGSEASAATEERTIADEFHTDTSTRVSDFTSEFDSALQASLGSYGSFRPDWSSHYSGSTASGATDVTTNTFANPICQGIWYTTNQNTGYDYWKTQFELQVGFYDITPVKVAGTLIGHTYNRVGGHLISLSGVWPAQGAVAIDNRQEGWGLSWQIFGQETLAVNGVTIFDSNALITMPGALAPYSIIEQYNEVTVKHGGSCPGSQYNNGGTCQN